MHVAGVSVFEAAELHTDNGGVDIARIRKFIASRLQYLPRYRQRLAWTPVEHHPVWIDDEHFNLDYHVRHTSLPFPGNDEQLKALTGRIFSQQLDRQKPLWEMWVVEGLEGDRFAIISKIHHAMIDGIAGTGIMGVILNVMPTSEVAEADEWTPRDTPTDLELIAGEVARVVSDSVDRARSARRAFEDTRTFVMGGVRKARAVYYSLSSGWLRQAAPTPINEPITPNRRFDWVETPLSHIKEIRTGLAGSVNDVVLAVTAGAIRSFFIEHRHFDDLDVDFRVMAPVSVRTQAQAGQLGNQVAMWLVSLPIDEPDPVERLEKIKQETMHLKTTEQALGAQTVVAASGGAPHTLMSLGARLATSIRPFNMTVTNVPGPQFPMYMLEARLVAQYPVVPLWHNHGVGIALFSYDGSIAWGINADWDVVPDPDVLGACILSAVTELREAARAAVAASASADDAEAETAIDSTEAPADETTPKKTTPRKTTPRKTTPKKATSEKPPTATTRAGGTATGEAASDSTSTTSTSAKTTGARSSSNGGAGSTSQAARQKKPASASAAGAKKPAGTRGSESGGSESGGSESGESTS
jgi:WS/DGAT/MGAT family acyltransferase